MATHQPIEITEADNFAALYYQQLIAGKVGKGDAFPEDDLRGWGPLFRQAYNIYQLDLELLDETAIVSEDVVGEHYRQAAKSALSSFEVLRRANDKLDTLIRGIGDDDQEEQQGSLAPRLPAQYATVDHSQGVHCRVWLDEWVAYAREVFPSANWEHIEAVGIWLLSTIVARRIVIKDVLPSDHYPILYLALASKSSVGKSMLADLGLELLKELGLKHKLTFTGESSPQWLTRKAAGVVDEAAYARMKTDEKRELERQTMIFAGFQGWFFDELGKELQRLNSPAGGPQAQRLVRLLLSWYSGHGESRASLTHGMDRVDEVYMPLLGCLTLTNVVQLRREGTGFWGDGFMARLIPVTSVSTKWIDVNLRKGRPPFPDSLKKPLLNLHWALGEPETRIVEENTTRGTAYNLERAPLEVLEQTLDHETFLLHNDYYNATGNLHGQEDLVPTEISACYRRLPAMAVSVASLLAAVGNGGHITKGHYIAAHEIVERWRENLHVFHQQIFIPEESFSRKTEDRVLKFIETNSRKNKKWVTESEIYRASRLSYDEVAKILQQNNGKTIVSCFVKHSKRPNDPTKKWAMQGTPLPLNGTFSDF